MQNNDINIHLHQMVLLDDMIALQTHDNTNI